MSALKQSRGPSTSVSAIVNHPLRSRCWHALVDKVASPAELAREFGVSVNDADYHVRVLVEIGVVELVAERPNRGAVEHFYRATKRPALSEDEIAEMDPEVALANATLITQICFADLSLSLDSGKFVERPDHFAMRLPMLLDEEGWAKVGSAYESLMELFYEVQAESAERRVKDPDRQSINATGFAFLFEKP